MLWLLYTPHFCCEVESAAGGSRGGGWPYSNRRYKRPPRVCFSTDDGNVRIKSLIYPRACVWCRCASTRASRSLYGRVEKKIRIEPNAGCAYVYVSHTVHEATTVYIMQKALRDAACYGYHACVHGCYYTHTKITAAIHNIIRIHTYYTRARAPVLYTRFPLISNVRASKL